MNGERPEIDAPGLSEGNEDEHEPNDATLEVEARLGAAEGWRDTRSEIILIVKPVGRYAYALVPLRQGRWHAAVRIEKQDIPTDGRAPSREDFETLGVMALLDGAYRLVAQEMEEHP